MAHSEVDSFVTKFKHLCHTGFRATLTIEAENGEASVVLKSGLGPIQPLNVLRHHGQPSRRRGPAYERRQERRQAAKAAGQVLPTTVEVRDAPASKDATPEADADDVSEHSEDVIADQAVAEETVANDSEKSTEKAESDFTCLLCDFRSNWENGLQIHMARKHCNLAQIDGNDTFTMDEIEDEKYAETLHYWKTGRLGTVFQCFLNANEIIENSNLESDLKTKEKVKVLEARKLAFGNHYRNFPPCS